MEVERGGGRWREVDRGGGRWREVYVRGHAYEGLTVFIIAEQIVSLQERPFEQCAHRFHQTGRRGVCAQFILIGT